jgi:hypothetical protein
MCYRLKVDEINDDVPCDDFRVILCEFHRDDAAFQCCMNMHTKRTDILRLLTF